MVMCMSLGSSLPANGKPEKLLKTEPNPQCQFGKLRNYKPMATRASYFSAPMLPGSARFSPYLPASVQRQQLWIGFGVHLSMGGTPGRETWP
jgi:hypothetical protein